MNIEKLGQPNIVSDLVILSPIIGMGMQSHLHYMECIIFFARISCYRSA